MNNTNFQVTPVPPKLIEIFYADDNLDDCFLFKECVQEAELPANLTTAADGLCAMGILSDESYKPDMIFLDINMPFKDGKRCLLEIRALKRFDAVPVIMYTTSDYIGDIKQCYDGGASAYVVKPWKHKDQLAMLRQLFSMNWLEYMPPPSMESFLLKLEEDIHQI